MQFQKTKYIIVDISIQIVLFTLQKNRSSWVMDFLIEILDSSQRCLEVQSNNRFVRSFVTFKIVPVIHSLVCGYILGPQ